jgi:PIN domain nuclease of toxin-antitoxin system
MKYLVDTHTFLWCVAASANIPAGTRARLEDPANEVYLSAVSLWEISIKSRIGKIDLGGLLPSDLIGYSEKMGFELIGLTAEEAISYGDLGESTHNDPFDRMLIWQAIQRNLQIVSKDASFQKFVPFGLKLVWR